MTCSAMTFLAIRRNFGAASSTKNSPCLLLTYSLSLAISIDPHNVPPKRSRQTSSPVLALMQSAIPVALARNRYPLWITAEPTRNLFSVVLPPPPPAPVFEVPAQTFVEPEVVLPVRLVGVLRIEGSWRASLADEFDLFIAEAGDLLPNGVEVIEVGSDYADVMFDGERTRLSLEGSNR